MGKAKFLYAWLGDIAEYWGIEDEDVFVYDGVEYSSIEELEHDYPELVGEQEDGTKTILLKIELETGKVVNWRNNEPMDFYDIKLVDTGQYWLVDKDGKKVIGYEGYVPVCIGSDGYGDYLEFEIDDNGFIPDFEFVLDKFKEECE